MFSKFIKKPVSIIGDVVKAILRETKYIELQLLTRSATAQIVAGWAALYIHFSTSYRTSKGTKDVMFRLGVDWPWGLLYLGPWTVVFVAPFTYGGESCRQALRNVVRITYIYGPFVGGPQEPAQEQKREQVSVKSTKKASKRR
jgi:hypothetical protein